MKTTKRELKKHLFICCNVKESGECCGTKGSLELVTSLKKRLRDNDLWDEYKVSKSGCLGPCSEGISATLYPDNLLMTGITPEDEDELYRLIYQDSTQLL